MNLTPEPVIITDHAWKRWRERVHPGDESPGFGRMLASVRGARPLSRAEHRKLRVFVKVRCHNRGELAERVALAEFLLDPAAGDGVGACFVAKREEGRLVVVTVFGWADVLYVFASPHSRR